MRTLALAVVLSVCHPGLAKPHSTPPSNSQSQSPPAQRFSDFEDEVIESSPNGPLGDQVSSRMRAISPSLIHLRQDFRREMLRSADAI
jgi:hypothetical protein